MEENEATFVQIEKCPYPKCSAKKDILDPTKMIVHLIAKKPEGHGLYGGSLTGKWEKAGFHVSVQVDGKGNICFTEKVNEAYHVHMMHNDPAYNEAHRTVLNTPKAEWMDKDGDPIDPPESTRPKKKAKGAKKKSKKDTTSDSPSSKEETTEEDKMADYSEKPDYITLVEDKKMKSDLVSQARELIQGFGKLPGGRTGYLEEKEFLRSMIKDLDIKKVPITLLRDYERKFHDEIGPEYHHRLKVARGELEEGEYDDGLNPLKKSRKPEVHSDIPRYRSQLRAISAKVMELPDEYEGDRLKLDGLIHDCFNKIRVSPTGDTVEEIKDIIEGEILPKLSMIQDKQSKAVISPISKPAGEQKTDWYGEVMRKDFEQKRMQYDQMRMEDMMDEMDERRKERMTVRKEKKVSGMVTVTRPVMDPSTGEIMRDANDNMMMETVQQPAHMAQGMDPQLWQMLVARKEDPMAQMMITILTQMMTEKNQTSDDPMFKMMMQQQQQNQAFMLQMLANKNDNSGDDMHRQEMMAMQTRLDEQNRINHQMQMEQMSQQMQGLMAMANRDPVDKLLDDREKYQKLGMIESPTRSLEEKTVEEWGKGMGKVADQMKDLNHSLETLSTPLINAMAENIKNEVQVTQQSPEMFSQQRQQQTGGPQSMDEAGKLRAYAGMLGNLEELDG